MLDEITFWLDEMLDETTPNLDEISFWLDEMLDEITPTLDEMTPWLDEVPGRVNGTARVTSDFKPGGFTCLKRWSGL